ncbi:MAG: hypothetical protein Q6K99_07030, partial [Thermostichales cyanobacterium BF4_bins_65]
VAGSVQILLPLQGIVDVGSLQRKLEKDLEKIHKEISSIQSRLDNPNFVGKAPPEILEKNRHQLSELQQQAAILEQRLHHLQ